MKVSVSTYIAYTYEADIDLDPIANLDEKSVWEIEDKDPAFEAITKVLIDKNVSQFDADTISICNAETGEILYEG